VDRVDVETAREMADAVSKALPADAAIMVAAVADWRVDAAPEKLKKEAGPPQLNFEKNPDILAGLCALPARPRLVIGFAAETENAVEQAIAKRTRKGCDWIVANDVSGDVMGGENNAFHIVTKTGVDSWLESPKDVIARKLMEKVADELAKS
jgi:phosphopantothenoylcysteine decarboxylase/phosphopantothenate--cysteine ligase